MRQFFKISKFIRCAVYSATVMALGIGHVGAQTTQDREVRPMPSLQDMAFPKNPRGCLNKASFTMAALDEYKKGVPITDLTDVRMFQMLYEDVYTQINKDGIEDTAIGALRDFNTCISEVKQKVNSEQKRAQYTTCTRLNERLLETLRHIQKGRSVNTLYDQYEARPLDFSNTRYNNIERPDLMFVGTLYRDAKSKDMTALSQDALQIGVGCAI